MHAWELRWTAAANDTNSAVDAGRIAIRELPILRENLRVALVRADSLMRPLLAGATGPAISALAASALSDFADESGVNLSAMQLHADSASASSDLAAVSVRMTGIGDIRGLMSLIQAIETDSAGFVVRELDVTQPEPAAPPNRQEALRFELLVDAIGKLSRRTEVRAK